MAQIADQLAQKAARAEHIDRQRHAERVAVEQQRVQAAEAKEQARQDALRAQQHANTLVGCHSATCFLCTSFPK